MPSEQQLSPRDLAGAYGVSESTMKRWIDAGELEASRTAGGHRRVGRAEAVRFGRRRGLPVLRPEALGLRAAPVGASAALTGSALVALLQSEAADTTPAVLVGAYLGGASLAELFDGPVREALGELGELWHGEDTARGIFLEHRAVPLVLRAIAEIRALVPAPGEGAPVAVGGAAATDPYMIPTAMAGAVLAEAGWRAVDLGPQTPTAALAAAARIHEADLVWLSASAPADALHREVAALAEAVAPGGTAVVLGGRAGQPVPATGVHALDSMQALAAFAAARPTAAAGPQQVGAGQ